MPKNSQVRTLGYSVRVAVVLSYFGMLCTAFALFLAAAALFSLLAGDFAFFLRIALVTAVLAGLGLPLRGIRAAPGIQVNEALVISALVFLVVSLAVAFPLMVPGFSFADALFESVSAITTTGLSTARTVRDKPVSFLITRAWLQWIGGLGIMILSVAVPLRPGTAARRIAETDMGKEDIAVSARWHARVILRVYLLLTLGGIAVLTLLGVDLASGLVHVLSAVSTGGFSSYDDSLAGLGGFPVRAVAMLVSFLGAIPLILYFHAFRRGWRELAQDPEFRALLVLGAFFSVLVTLSLGTAGSLSLADSAKQGTILAFSAQTTTGFTSTPVPTLPPGTKLLLILSMLVGGGSGSTAGGFKVIRLLILLRTAQMVVNRAHLPPHAVVRPRIASQPLEEDEIGRGLLLILLFAAVVVLSWVPFVVLGYDPLDALFEVVSATATVGLSAGVSTPELPAVLKGILCADMLLGRLEIVAFLVLFAPQTWIGRRAKTA